MERVIFYILAIIIISTAIASVTNKKILRSVVYLLFTLLGIAGIYFMLDYAFLGAVQMAVYAGGIIILFIFSVLLVHQVEQKLEEPSSWRKTGMAVLSIIGIGLTLSTIFSYDFKVGETYGSVDVKTLGEGLLSTGENGFILPFEVISVLLLAAMIGAIIIVKQKRVETKS